MKQLSSKSHQGNREFVNEIGMISGLNHPNLVKLYGCCVEKNQLMLVYEYMENNSLAHMLHGISKSYSFSFKKYVFSLVQVYTYVPIFKSDIISIWLKLISRKEFLEPGLEGKTKNMCWNCKRA